MNVCGIMEIERESERKQDEEEKKTKAFMFG